VRSVLELGTIGRADRQPCGALRPSGRNRGALARASAPGRTKRGGMNSNWRGRLARYVERFVRPLLDASGARVGWLEVYRDITGQRLMQSKRLQTEKMAALGQLVSGIAHELINPLTSIQGYAQLLVSRRSAIRSYRRCPANFAGSRARGPNRQKSSPVFERGQARAPRRQSETKSSSTLSPCARMN